MRFPLEIVRAVRRVWAQDKPFGMRLSVTDWLDGGFNPDEAVRLVAAAKIAGVDYVCASSGGISPQGVPPAVGPGYQLHLAQKLRRETGVVTRAVGMIVDPHQAESILAEGKADWVALARAFLDDPRWAWHAAAALGADAAYPPPYLRACPEHWPGFALTRHRATPERS